MKTFKTPAGTELPLMDLKGKDYLQVAHRIRWFREEHPNGRIDTERTSESANHVTYRATIYFKSDQGYVKISNADKTVAIKNMTDYEKCETAAIGRALALCGYGTQFADDIEEGETLADAPGNFNGVPENEDFPPFDSLPDTGVPKNLKKKPTGELPADIGMIKFKFGQWKGKSFDEVIRDYPVKIVSYCSWIIGKLQKGEKVDETLTAFVEYSKSKGYDIK